jgi:hypothetical protein
MHLAEKRHFTLIDAVALIAATAIGFALARAALTLLTARGMRSLARPRWIQYGALHGMLWTIPVLFALSIAILALSLRQPRPRSRLIIRSPGFVMNIAAISGVFCVSLHHMGEMALDPGRVDVIYVQMVSSRLPGDVGYFVAGSLVALALFGRLRPRPIWTDRLAYSIGWLWVGMTLLHWARVYLHLLG